MSGIASRIPGPADLRAATWTLRELADLRRRLDEEGADARIAAPPELPAGAVRAVKTALKARRASCLESSLVLQEWHLAHDRPLDLVIGVTAPGADFHAHAWLEEEDPRPGEEFTEILRRPARVASNTPSQGGPRR